MPPTGNGVFASTANKLAASNIGERRYVISSLEADRQSIQTAIVYALELGPVLGTRAKIASLERTSAFAGRIRLLKHPAFLVPAFALVLLWPLLFIGSPVFYGDSPGYLKGGPAVFRFLQSDIQSGSVGGASKLAGIRSVAYSVFAYLTHFPGDSWLATCLLQALPTSWLAYLVSRSLGIGRRPRLLIATAAILAFGSTAPWFVIYAGPDIFAGLAILAVALLVSYPLGSSLWERLGLSAIVYFAACAHVSHVPILVALVALVCLMVLLRRRRSGLRAEIGKLAWVVTPVAVAIATLMVGNAIAFRTLDIAAKAYPIPLARSIEDGPARWYLEEHCATERYAVCEIYDTFPTTAGEFLFGPKTGVRFLATPEQLDRIRAEQSTILAKATQAYPWAAFAGAAEQSFKQLLKFGLGDHSMDFRMIRNVNGSPDVASLADPRLGLRRTLSTWLAIPVVVAFAGLILLWITGVLRRPSPERALLLTVVAGCLINAIVCGSLSASTDRYQGRVIWAFVLTVGALGGRTFLDRGKANTERSADLSRAQPAF